MIAAGCSWLTAVDVWEKLPKVLLRSSALLLLHTRVGVLRLLAGVLMQLDTLLMLRLAELAGL